MITQLITRDTKTAVSTDADWADALIALAASMSQPGMEGEPLKFSKGALVRGSQ
jgi:hypothetical protein